MCDQLPQLVPFQIETAPSPKDCIAQIEKHEESCPLPETFHKPSPEAPYSSGADPQVSSDFDYENTTSIQEVWHFRL